MTPDHQSIHSPNDRQVTSNRTGGWWRTVTSEAAAIALGFAFLFSLRYLARPLALLFWA